MRPGAGPGSQPSSAPLPASATLPRKTSTGQKAAAAAAAGTGSMPSTSSGAAADPEAPCSTSGNGRDAEEEKSALLSRTGSKALRSAVAQAPKQAVHQIVHSWFSRKFATGCAILLPIVITFWVTYRFLQLFDGIFSPLYVRMLGFEVFGLGFMTSILFITLTGMFFQSWLGSWTLTLGEWIIRRLPLVKHIYNASKQVSGALNPESSGEAGTKAFQECVLARHPRHGEYALAFITGRTLLQTHEGDMRLVSVYVPTNHVYVGDIYLLDERDIIHTNLSVREGLEIVVSVGMALPPTLAAIQRRM